jgi:hypothetical protein
MKNATQLKFVNHWIANEILFRSSSFATRASKLIPGSIKTRFAQTVDAASPPFH